MQDIKNQQAYFYPSSPYLNEIETAVYNYPLFASMPSTSMSGLSQIETWSLNTQSTVNCYTNNTIHHLLMEQRERVLRIAFHNLALSKREPRYGQDCIRACSIYKRPTELTGDNQSYQWNETTSYLTKLAPSFTTFCESQQQNVSDYTILVEKTRPCFPLQVTNKPSSHLTLSPEESASFTSFNQTLHTWNTLNSIQFPEKRLVEYDCGKLIVLSTFLSFFLTRRNAPAVTARRTSLPVVYADVPHVGHLRDLPQHASLHISANGRLHITSPASENDGEV